MNQIDGNDDEDWEDEAEYLKEALEIYASPSAWILDESSGLMCWRVKGEGPQLARARLSGARRYEVKRMSVKNTEEQIIFSDAWGDVEFSDNSKSGNLRVLIDVGQEPEKRARWRLSGDDVVELRDWLNSLIAIYERPSIAPLKAKTEVKE
jgi:hypothetical protein